MAIKVSNGKILTKDGKVRFGPCGCECEPIFVCEDFLCWFNGLTGFTTQPGFEPQPPCAYEIEKGVYVSGETPTHRRPRTGLRVNLEYQRTGGSTKERITEPLKLFAVAREKCNMNWRGTCNESGYDGSPFNSISFGGVTNESLFGGGVPTVWRLYTENTVDGLVLQLSRFDDPSQQVIFTCDSLTSVGGVIPANLVFEVNNQIHEITNLTATLSTDSLNIFNRKIEIEFDQTLEGDDGQSYRYQGSMTFEVENAICDEIFRWRIPTRKCCPCEENPDTGIIVSNLCTPDVDPDLPGTCQCPPENSPRPAMLITENGIAIDQNYYPFSGTALYNVNGDCWSFQQNGPTITTTSSSPGSPYFAFTDVNPDEAFFDCFNCLGCSSGGPPPPPPPSGTGACCINGNCSQTTEQSCFANGGTFFGVGSRCNDIDCNDDPDPPTVDPDSPPFDDTSDDVCVGYYRASINCLGSIVQIGQVTRTVKCEPCRESDSEWRVVVRGTKSYMERKVCSTVPCNSSNSGSCGANLPSAFEFEVLNPPVLPSVLPINPCDSLSPSNTNEVGRVSRLGGGQESNCSSCNKDGGDIKV